MTADLLADWWVHDIQVERFTGSGANGNTYAATATVTGFLDDASGASPLSGQKIIRTANGEEIVVSAVLYLPLTVAELPVQSRVTLPAVFDNRECFVVSTARRDGGGLDLPEHWEVGLR